MTSITEQKSIKRDYQLGTCYICQLCLTCNKELAFNTCNCNVNEKLKSSKASKSKRKFYSRVYNSSKIDLFSQLQIDKLKECDEYFGYYSDFDGYFQVFFCTKCYSRFTKLKNNNTKAKKNASESNLDSYDSTPLPTSPSSQNITEDSVHSDSDCDNSDITEFKFKLVIKPYDGKARPAKWVSFKVLSLTEFEDEILDLVQNQYNSLMRKDEYTIIYKQSSSHGTGILLLDEKDWKNFLPEYKKILFAGKDLMIIIEIKEKSNKTKRR